MCSNANCRLCKRRRDGIVPVPAAGARARNCNCDVLWRVAWWMCGYDMSRSTATHASGTRHVGRGIGQRGGGGARREKPDCFFRSLRLTTYIHSIG